MRRHLLPRKSTEKRQKAKVVSRCEKIDGIYNCLLVWLGLIRTSGTRYFLQTIYVRQWLLRPWFGYCSCSTTGAVASRRSSRLVPVVRWSVKCFRIMTGWGRSQILSEGDDHALTKVFYLYYVIKQMSLWFMTQTQTRSRPSAVIVELRISRPSDGQLREKANYSMSTVVVVVVVGWPKAGQL